MNKRHLPIGVSHRVFHTLLAQLMPSRRAGRPRQLSVAQQLEITLFKLRYNLPYRVLEAITSVDHVTLSRAVKRTLLQLSALPLAPVPTCKDVTCFVDTTTIRIGRHTTQQDYTGYKHLRGIKFQCVALASMHILAVSAEYSAAIHDKNVFEQEYAALPARVRQMTIVGDKAYVGLSVLNVFTPLRRSDTVYCQNPAAAKRKNKRLSQRRVVIEHVFAALKRYRSLLFANYFERAWVCRMFRAICVVHNTELQVKMGT